MDFWIFLPWYQTWMLVGHPKVLRVYEASCPSLDWFLDSLPPEFVFIKKTLFWGGKKKRKKKKKENGPV